MNKIGFEPRTRFETVDFCNSTLQNSLEKLLKEMGFDYAGIWLPNGNGYMPMYEAGITTFLKSSTCSEQIRAAGVSESPLFKCPTDSTEGGVDAVFSFRDITGNPFAYVLMDDIDDARELSDDEVNLFLDSYYKDTHTLLLESRIFALEAKLEGVRARLSEAEERSNVDGLTGLLVRRRVEEILTGKILELASSNETKSIAVCLADIDHFKKVNDTYGHQIGDSVLKRFSEVVNIGHHSNGFAHSRRNTDVFGRFGGEEFIFVLPDTPLEKAALFADKIRRIIGSIDFEDAEGGRFKKTVSFGVSEITKEQAIEAGTTGIPQLIFSSVKKADERLYVAKNSGRNQVVSIDAPLNP